MSNLAISAIFQTPDSGLLWGFTEGETQQQSRDLANKWIDVHAHLFIPAELDQIHIRDLTSFRSSARDHFLVKFAQWHIDYYDFDEIPMTKYEHSIYAQIVDEWYKMYQDVIIASHILPTVMAPEGDVFQPLNLIKDGAEEMYRKIDSKKTFASYLSTNYIKNAVLLHPIQAMMLYKDEEDRKMMFRYQLFKDEKESEVTTCKD